MSFFLKLLILLLSGRLVLSAVGKCSYYASETYVKSYQSSYGTSCGFWGLSRCTRYRTKYRYDTRQVLKYRCCKNYVLHNSACEPLCQGQRWCPNGGHCSSPNFCSNCNPGYYSPKCDACPLSRISDCFKMTCSSGPSNFVCQECRLSSHSGSAYLLSNNRCLPKCSWLSNTGCWPGTCNDRGLTSSCSCIAGFAKKYGTNNCDIASVRPNLLTCTTRAVSASNEYADSSVPNGSPNSCGNQQDFWSNFQPTEIGFTFTFEFKVSNIPARPSHINDFVFGITDAYMQVTTLSKTGVTKYSGNNHYISRCTHTYSSSTPQPSTITCTNKLTFEGVALQNNDKYCLSYKAVGGGYFRTKNLVYNTVSSKEYYTPVLSSKSVCLLYDNAEPIHCSQTSTCPLNTPYETDPLELTNRITKNSNVTVSYGGWSDTGSGVAMLEFTLYSMAEKSSNLLGLKDQVNQSVKIPRNGEGSVQFVLPGQGLYCVTAQVLDVSGNTRLVRRFVLYDSLSNVAIGPKPQTFKVISAVANTNYVWQTNLNSINILWARHFYNTFHVHNNMLRPIETNSLVSGSYDQITGDLPVMGTRNVDGIIRFQYAVAKLPSNMPRLTTLRGVPTSLTLTPKLRDGDTYRIWVQAKDVMGNVAIDNITLHIDSSPPLLTNAGLIENGYKKLFVHSVDDLSKMKLEFDAMDSDSGLHDVKWKLGTTEGSADISDGSLVIVKTSTGGDNVYCPTLVDSLCEYYNYSIKLNHLIAENKHRGNHNRDYYFTLTSRNKALLSNSPLIVKILVDTSPPTTGVVRDGPGGSHHDVQHQSTLTLSGNWHGFFDHESGVRFYRFVFGENCMSKQNVTLFGRSTTANFATDVVTKDGKYYLSVVAYNGAHEPSEAACSNGVIVDRTIPKFKNIQFDGLRVHGGITCSFDPELKVWHVNSYYTRVQLHPTDECKSLCSSTQSVDTLRIPELKPANNSDGAINASESDAICKQGNIFKKSFPKYITTDHVRLRWDSVSGSPIEDYKIGFSRADLETTHGAPFYSKTYSGFGQGDSFYLWMQIISKSGTQSKITLGPIFVDETPPQFSGTLSVNVGSKREDPITISWSAGAIYDEEYSNGIDKYQYAVGDEFTIHSASPFQAFVPQSCDRGTQCLHVEKGPIQKHDAAFGRSYSISIKVFNRAGLSSVFTTSLFNLTSGIPPSVGVVYDVDGDSSYGSLVDDDFMKPGKFCVRWSGFRSQDEIEYDVGLGTAKNLTDVVSYISATQLAVVGKDYVCLTLPDRNLSRVFSTVKASVKHDSSSFVVASSDGAYILRRNIQKESLKIFDGLGCKHVREYEDAPGFTLNGSTGSTHSLRFKQVEYLSPLYTVKLSSSEELTAVKMTQKGAEPRNVQNDFDGSKYFAYYTFEWRNDPFTFDVVVTQGSSLVITTASLTKCSIDNDYQSASNFLSGYWRYSSPMKGYVTHYECSVAEDVCSLSGCTISGILVQQATAMDFCQFSNMTLISGNRYRILVRPCFQHHCLEESSSDGVIVAPASPTKNDISAEIEFTGSSGTYSTEVVVNWQKFHVKNGNLQQDIDLYEWTLSRSHLGKDPGLLWRGAYNKTHDKATVDWKNHRLQTMYLLVKGYSLANVYTTAVKNLTSPEQVTTFDTAVHDLTKEDMDSFSPIVHTKNILSSTLSRLHIAEVDFTNISTTAYAVLAAPLYDTYTWTLTTVNNPELNCSVSPHCVAVVTNSKNNVEFGKLNLINGVEYFSCVRTKNLTRSVGNQLQQLPELKMCSNGFVIDTTPPVAGVVSVVNSENRFVTTYNYLHIRWTAFDDLLGTEEHRSSGIMSYYYSVGTAPGFDDVVPKTPTRLRTEVIIEHVKLQNGKEYFVTVSAEDHARHSTSASAPPFVVDTSPPVTGKLLVGSAYANYQHLANHMLQFHWSNFEDTESGVIKYEFALGSEAHHSDVIPFSSVLLNYIDIDGGLLIDGHTYYPHIKVTNGAGLATVLMKKFVYDSSPPSDGVVRDCANLTYLADIDYQTSTTRLCASWDGFHDTHSGIADYRIGFHKEGGVPNLSSVGRLTSMILSASLRIGEKYVITVEGCNGVGLCTRASSDGVFVDPSPPSAGIVMIGTRPLEHKRFQASRKYITMSWLGFSDLQSGVDSYDCGCIGTAAGECDLHPFQECHDVHVHVLRLRNKLPLGVPIYATVRSWNKVGLSVTKSSAPVIVDNSHPLVKKTPKFSSNPLLSRFDDSQFETNVLALEWEFVDTNSSLVRHIVSVRSHYDGDHSVYKELVNEKSLTVTFPHDKRLTDGHRYFASLTACNEAGLCTSANTTDGLLVDSSPPHVGEFKTLTWTQEGGKFKINFLLSGFVDPHSGIKSFLIGVGFNYSSHELSGGYVALGYSSVPGTSDQRTELVLDNTPNIGGEVFVSVIAENNVGLRSPIFKKFAKVVQTSNGTNPPAGILVIERHSCQVPFCNNDCACAPVGGVCDEHSVSACRDISKPPSNVKVKFGTTSEMNLAFNQKCITAHWTSDLEQNIVRYQYSVGESGAEPGHGIFDAANEAVWHNIDLWRNITLCLQKDRFFASHQSYVFYIRAWFSSHSYTQFSSNISTIDVTPPVQRKGRQIIDCLDATQCDYDIEFSPSTSQVAAKWYGVFNDVTSGIKEYEVMVGEFPGGETTIPRFTTKDTSFTRYGMKLTQGTTYFTTVKAINNLGMYELSSSDGVLIDDSPPETGIVFNTNVFHSKPASPDPNCIGASWNGFDDLHSHISDYQISVGSGGQNDNLIRLRSVGLQNSVKLCSLDLQHGTTYNIYVQARDAAGHVSKSVSSDSFLVDTTPPEGTVCTKWSEMPLNAVSSHTKNESGITYNIRTDPHKLYELYVYSSSYWPKAFISSVGLHYDLSFHDLADGGASARYVFTIEENKTSYYTLNVDSAVHEIDVALRTCENEERTVINGVVQLRQLGPHSLQLYFLVRDGESGIKEHYAGIGTTPGGFQVGRFRNLGHQQQFVYSINLPHGTPVYGSVMSENNAGLQFYFSSSKLIVDYTPPVISGLTVVVLGAVTNNSSLVQTSWESKDLESGVNKCKLQIGTHPFSGNILPLSPIDPIGNDMYNVTRSVELVHGQLIYSTIWCSNNAELSTTVVSGEERVVSKPPSIDEASVMFLLPQSGPYDRRINAIFNVDYLDIRWSGFQYVGDSVSYKIRLVTNSTIVVPWTNVGGLTNVRLGNLTLTHDECYSAEVRAVTARHVTTNVVSKHLCFDGNPPQTTGNSPAVTYSEKKVVVDWQLSFVHEVAMWYEICLGLSEGACNVLQPTETKESFVSTTLKYLDLSKKEVFGVINAVKPSGNYKTLKFVSYVP